MDRQSCGFSNHFLRKLDRQMLLWVEEHGGADAVFAVGTMEDIGR